MVILDIQLKNVDRVYRSGETVSGVVVVKSNSSVSHSGITLRLYGEVTLQLSAKSVGLFEAFYSSLKPVQLCDYTVTVAKSGRLPKGTTALPFEFELRPNNKDIELYETYHGVFVNIQYMLTCDMVRGVFAKDLQKKLEFIVEQIPGPPPSPVAVPFTVVPQSLENVKKTSVDKIPPFKITGQITSAKCHIGQPFTGELVVEESVSVIKSIELQLLRVETCGSAEGWAKEATEIQNIQVGEGDVARGISIPLYMVFPRLFTAPTLSTKTFKIEFEVNLVVLFKDGHLVSHSFPIKLVR